MTKINLNKIALLSATSLLFSTAAHAQVADTWDIQDAVSVTAQNTGTVTVDTAGGTTAAGIDSANITDGYKNSISAAAVGSSASSSFNTFVNDGTTGDTSVLTTAGGLTVTAGNTGAVANSSDTVNLGPVIQGGSGNSVSFAAVGSSASNSISVGVAGGSTIDTASFVTGDAIIVQSGDGETAPTALTIGDAGGNVADVTVGMGTSLLSSDIAGGQCNSISVAGVGSSASFSISASQADKSTLGTYDVEVGAVTVTSSNAPGTGTTPGVSNTATLFDNPKIDDGNSNSISAAAVGSSASVSVSNTFFQGPSGDAGGTITDGTVSFGDLISASSFNSAAVSNGTDLGGDTGGATIGAGAGSNSSNNSISVASVGSSASASFSVTSYDAASASGVATTAQGITLASTNTGNVLTTAGMLTPSIEGGYNNAISAAAVGASASQSVSHVSLPVN